MPFGLANTPSTFQNYINDVLGPDILDIFGTAYVDDILVYSQTLKEHWKHVKLVLSRLRDASLQVDISKCDFEVYQVKYLGLIIQSATEDSQPRSVSMDPAKTNTIKKWKPPASLKEVQSFIAFANFYHRFIKDFAKLASPLTALTKKNVAFKWETPEQRLFESIKKAFSTAPILQHFDPEKECVVETDTSDYVSGAVLSQPDHEGVLHPVAFLSRHHLPAECNYKIYDKELLAIVCAFEEWRAELEESPEPVKVISDHKNLEYFMSSKCLSHCQACWSKFLSHFNFKISYCPGSQCKADTLTRRSQDFLSDSDPCQDFME